MTYAISYTYDPDAGAGYLKYDNPSTDVDTSEITSTLNYELSAEPGIPDSFSGVTVNIDIAVPTESGPERVMGVEFLGLNYFCVRLRIQHFVFGEIAQVSHSENKRLDADTVFSRIQDAFSKSLVS